MEFAGISSGAQAPARAERRRRAGDRRCGRRRAARRARSRRHASPCTPNGTLPPVIGRRGRAAIRGAEHRRQRGEVQRRAAPPSTSHRAYGECAASQIRVVDRGLGIDADDLPHIFKPFYRGRRAVDAQVRGTGVGLSVVRHVVDAHRRHDCTSTAAPAKGRRSSSSCPADVALGFRRARLTSSASPRVLLVEDEAGLRLTLSDRLVSEGYAVETASDGEVGLARGDRAAATTSSSST